MVEFLTLLLFCLAGIGGYHAIVDCAKLCSSLIKKIKEHKNIDGRNN